MSHVRKFPRLEAVQGLEQVLAHQEHLDAVIEKLVQKNPSIAQERAWLLDTCAGTLRWWGPLYEELEELVSTKMPKGFLQIVLMMTGYQVRVQERVNGPAAINETVELIKREESHPTSQFANAVLRKWLKKTSDEGLLPSTLTEDRITQSARASLPEWMWSRLHRHYGLEWAQRFAKISFERPQVWTRTHGEHSIVQNISSQKIIEDVSKVLETELCEKQGMKKDQIRCLDLCSSPGGKAIGLAWNGFRVIATDRKKARFKRLQDAPVRLGLQDQIQVIPYAEAMELSELDAVWIDAPCSGSGTLRKHPEIRWIRLASAMNELSMIQKELLSSAWKMLRPGGILIYSVCSILPEEGEARVKLQSLPEASFLYSQSLFPQDPPYGDGFYACVLQKNV